MLLKKYINPLFIVLFILLLIIIGITLNNNFPKKISSASETTQSIENDIPTKIDVPANQSESGKAIESVDNKEIDKRYEKINKNKLTYETTDTNLDKNYFYEFKNGLALKREDNSDLKPINSEKYARVLLGYSYSGLDESFSKDQALNKVKSILPDNSKEIYKKAFNDYELIKYNTNNGNFIVLLGYKTITDVQKNNIQDIYYYKEIK